MRYALAALVLMAPSSVLVSSAVAAQEVKSPSPLIASAPAKNASGKGAVDRVSLQFSESVDLLSVSVYRPDDQEVEVFTTAFAPETKKRGKDFTFPLAEALSEAGRYKISYLIATKSNKSINGFIDFTIEPKFPVPHINYITPADGEEVSGPITTLEMVLDRDVDLISFDLKSITAEGDNVSMETVQSFIDGSSPENSVRKGREFSFSLAKPVATPGDYAISYGYTVNNPDGSISPFKGVAKFTVK